MRIFVYPGSFDPVTNGHLDIINRASRICDKLIVLVSVNTAKTPAFTVDERLELLRLSVGKRDNIEITSFSGLLVDFMRKVNAKTIIKGLRAVSDFEYEMQMALANRKLYPDIETLFMVSSSDYTYLSSSLVKEIAMFDGDISCLVPKIVREALTEKLKGGK